GLAARELPARQALGDDEFQERADEHRPQHADAEHAADDARRGEIAAADTGRGEQQARADDCKQRGARLHRCGVWSGWHVRSAVIVRMWASVGGSARDTKRFLQAPRRCYGKCACNRRRENGSSARQIMNASASMTERDTTTKKRELIVFLFLALVLAPVLAVIGVAGYGFCVWMFQIIVG